MCVNMIKYQSLLCLCLCLSVSVSLSLCVKVPTSEQLNKERKKRVFLFALLLLCLYSFQSLCSLYWDFSIQRHKDTTTSPLDFLSLVSLSLSLSLFSSEHGDLPTQGLRKLYSSSSLITDHRSQIIASLFFSWLITQGLRVLRVQGQGQGASDNPLASHNGLRVRVSIYLFV